MSTLIFGHKNPDTDTITAAITLAEFEKQDGNTDVEAVALGTPNAETKFALDFFKLNPLRVVKTVANETEHVDLVDHNEAQQSVDDRADVTIDKVIDHHRVANFQTEAPLYMRVEPLGSANSVIYKMFKEKGYTISPLIASLMASGLISDTLLLKSPTTTDQDRAMFADLQKIADVDLKDYGMKMLKAGTNLAARSDQDIIDGDAKSFTMGGKTVRIDQVNTVDLNDIYDRQDAIVAAMQAEKDAEGYDLFVVIATDIMNSNSTAFALGEKDKLEDAFGKKFDANDRLDLPGVVSRKKQVVPVLTDSFEK
ncbi:manganese-dependent inorganic pyrophosphatase [Lacticaseibacillus pabuli]|uniref:inorganic diphosphatase n=1 Tax=Lacticaseibacillus pabuli TaxID=3025672 RepID=A0ABY7WN32_9LACO|nr:manganese-dependent inorganic pyrophosphatase [Lacticaseibacillus sp. KACC 23028]WDF81541.1 manganese-dependent inorganic pyrophosphatase [Lacticaseibacillus sp. KACC 23028]